MDKKTIKRLLTYCKPYRFLIMLLTLLSIVSVVFTYTCFNRSRNRFIGWKESSSFSSVIEQTYFYWNCYFNYFFDSMDHGTNYKYNYL